MWVGVNWFLLLIQFDSGCVLCVQWALYTTLCLLLWRIRINCTKMGWNADHFNDTKIPLESVRKLSEETPLLCCGYCQKISDCLTALAKNWIKFPMFFKQVNSANWINMNCKSDNTAVIRLHCWNLSSFHSILFLNKLKSLNCLCQLAPTYSIMWIVPFCWCCSACVNYE